MQEIQSVKVELKADIGSVNAKVMEATDEIHGIKTQLNKVTGELKADILDLQEHGLKASNDETTALKEQVAELQADMREMTQRDIRKTNLVVFNLPESEAEDAENRKSHDKERFLQLCDEMDIEGITVTGVTRLQASAQRGQAGATNVNPAPRPLRVRVESEAMRTKVVNQGRVLRMSENESTRQVFLKRDMTPLERADMRCRREKWRQKRANQDGPDNPPPNHPPEM